MQKLLSRFYYGWVITLIGFIVITIIYGNKFCFGTLFGALLDEFGWSRAMVTSVFSVSILSQAFLQPLGGALLDRFGPKKMILTGAFLLAVSLAIFGQAQSLFSVYLSYGILFSLAAVAAGMVVNTTMISRWFVRKRGLAVTIVGVGTGIGLAIFNPLLAYLMQTYGWRTSVTGLGIVSGLIVILLVGILVKDHPQDIGQYVDGMSADEAEQINITKTTLDKNSIAIGSDFSFKEAIATREFWLLLLSYLFYLATWYGITNHAVMAMCDMGLSTMQAATLFGYTGLIGTVAGVAGAWLSDMSKDRKIMLIIAYILFCVGCLIFAFNPGGIHIMFLWVLIIGSAHGAALILSAVVADRFGVKSMGKIWGTITMSGLLGGAIGPIIVARLYDPVYSYSMAWKLLAVISFLAVLCIVFVRRTPRRFFFLADENNEKVDLSS